MSVEHSPAAIERVVVGTRASRLALAQTAIIVEMLQRQHLGLEVVTERITTAGDRASAAGQVAAGAKGSFATELEQALLAGRIDLAVHSAKDLPGENTVGLCIGAAPCRADPRDALVSRDSLVLTDLPAGATVGTSSPRRRAQLLRLRPDLDIQPLRGNVDTRVAKVAAGRYDAIILAKAGLERLGLASRIVETLAVETMVPAPGQGTLAVQIRADDRRAERLVAPLENSDVRLSLDCERAVAARLAGGCLVPIGVLAEVKPGGIELTAVVLTPDGRGLAFGRHLGGLTELDRLVDLMVEDLRGQGADKIIASRDD